MFEKLIHTLENIDGQTIYVPLEADEKGYTDRQCPSEECEFIYKVHEEDWTNLFNDELVWCPLCRYDAPSENWFVREQVETAKRKAFEVVQGQIATAMKSDAKNFNRNKRSAGFVSISMSVSGGKRKTTPIPIASTEALQLEIQCEKCAARFAVIGSAYFCPACGYNSVKRMYHDSLRKIRAKKENIDFIKNALSDAGSMDDAELISRSLIESCLNDGVAAFQKYCDMLFSEYYGSTVVPLNAFQRLQEGSDLWKSEIGEGYPDWLTKAELRDLNILYQKRHLLEHNQGIVDEKYLKKCEDNYLSVGQRIVIKDKDIDMLLRCLEKLRKGIIRKVKI